MASLAFVLLSIASSAIGAHALPPRATVRDIPGDSQYYNNPVEAPRGVIVKMPVHPIRWAQASIAVDVLSACYALGRDGFSEDNPVYGGSGCEVVAPLNIGLAYLLERVARKDKRRCGHWKIESDKKKLKRCRRSDGMGWLIFAVRAPVAANNVRLILEERGN